MAVYKHLFRHESYDTRSRYRNGGRVQLDPETVRRNVAAALAEDIGPGDINAELIDADKTAVAHVVSRDAGVLCGEPWVTEACRQVGEQVGAHWLVEDGERLGEGDRIVELTGPAHTLLTVERTAINFLQLLSGTATLTAAFVNAVAGTSAVILDTRKTLPGLRVAQKYAVRIGGADNHRMGLFDAFLLKENHIAAAGSIRQAVAAARRLHPDVLLQVEVETITQLGEAIAHGADRVLLDNFSTVELEAAVAAANGRVPLEASGGITLANVGAIAATGVDFISIGELTKRVSPLDLSMRFVSTCAS